MKCHLFKRLSLPLLLWYSIMCFAISVQLWIVLPTFKLRASHSGPHYVTSCRVTSVLSRCSELAVIRAFVGCRVLSVRHAYFESNRQNCDVVNRNEQCRRWAELSLSVRLQRAIELVLRASVPPTRNVVYHPHEKSAPPKTCPWWSW